MLQYWYQTNAQSIGKEVVAIFTVFVYSLLLFSHSSSPCCFQKSKVNSSEGEVEELENCEDTHSEKETKTSTKICWKKNQRIAFKIARKGVVALILLFQFRNYRKQPINSLFLSIQFSRQN